MIINFVNERLWQATVAPDNDVHDALNAYPNVGDWFCNTTTGLLYLCRQSGVASQIWELAATIPDVNTLIMASQADWTQATSSNPSFIKNKPTLATVATSGSYNDLSNKPTIPAAQIQSDWTQTNNSSVDFIKNKPVLSFTTPTFASSVAATQLSATRNAQVSYTYPTSMTSLLANQTLTATLQYADDSGFTTNVVNLNNDVQGCSGILSLTLLGRLQVQGIIPAGKYRRVVLAQTGGATVPTTLSSGQEVLL